MWFQNEVVNRQIQKEIWRIQDVMEGLRKNNPSRGTDTAKHRGGSLLRRPPDGSAEMLWSLASIPHLSYSRLSRPSLWAQS